MSYKKKTNMESVALEEQRQKLQMLGQFAGGTAHDFNNILSIIKGYAESIERRVQAGQGFQDQLCKIIETTQRGAGITRQLLAFGRQSIGLDEVVDLNAHILSQKHLLETALESINTLDLHLCDHLVKVECDPEAIVRILLNMTMNARDAMPNGGGILSIHTDVSSDQGQEMAHIKISDTGSGISPEVMDSIFEPFFTTKGQGKGTGLGLSMTFGLVDQMQGQISVSSEVNHGTSFDIFLPMTDKEITYQPDDQPLMTKGGLSGCTVLLAEDEPDLRDVLTEMLTSIGMTVLAAEDANQALVIQEGYERPIDFLLTDIVMPQMSGQKLAELFQSLRPDTQIIYMSGYPYGHDAVKNLNTDVPFLSKPLNQGKLQETLLECLGKEGFKSKH